MTIQSRSSARIHKLLLAVLVLLPASLLAEPVTLHHAVELALKHATGISIAASDEQHASASYRELRNSYIPQLNAGAGIGWSDGFPLSLEGAAPSLFNVTAQSALINPALKDFIRASQSDVAVSTLQTKDQRNQVIQDTVLSYAELSKWELRLSHLRETMAAAEQTQTAVAQRVKEGVDSEIDGSKARLSVARLRLRLAEAGGAADVLREHLSRLTGLQTSSFEIDPDSVPALPALKPEEDSLVKAIDASPVVQAAVEHARAQYLRAAGEHRSLWPSVDFAAQYANLADYNNYEAYYKHFQPNNATVGVAIHHQFCDVHLRGVDRDRHLIGFGVEFGQHVARIVAQPFRLSAFAFWCERDRAADLQQHVRHGRAQAVEHLVKGAYSLGALAVTGGLNPRLNGASLLDRVLRLGRWDGYDRIFLGCRRVMGRRPSAVRVRPCSRPSRTLRAAQARWPTAILDRRCARRPKRSQVGTTGWPCWSNHRIGSGSVSRQ